MSLTMKDKRVLTKAMCEQYRKATKKVKGQILDQFVEANVYDRCYARGQLRPFEFDAKSLRSLLNIGVRWFVTDEPRRFADTVAKAMETS